jgi:alpha-mannosidase
MPTGRTGRVLRRHDALAGPGQAARLGGRIYFQAHRGTYTTQAKTKQGNRRSLENECVRLTLDAAGEIISIMDRTCGRETAAGPCNAFKLYKDVPSWFDAWDINSPYKLQPVVLTARAKLEVVANGPLVATLRLTRKINHSELTQEISVRAGSPRVE